jgi:SPP1 gp7 family putative phage head morphogenesis protein
MIIFDNVPTKELFKFKLSQQAQLKRNNKIKLKKSPNQLPPISNEKRYTLAIQKIMSRYVQITIQKIKPLLREWNRQNKLLLGDDVITQDLKLAIDILKDGIIYDDPTDDLTEIDEEWEELRNEIFGKQNANNLNSTIIGFGTATGIHNQKQWQKVLNKTTGTNFIIGEPWEEPILKAWTNRNVNLIKGLTEEYRKKIKETVLSGWQSGITAEELAKQLTEINQNFATGGFKIVNGRKIRKQSRSMLIARDQINKLNGMYSRRRQLEAGVEMYTWITMADERVRPRHRVLDGKICRWDDPTVYANSIEEALAGEWRSRGDIGAVLLHPGQDFQCRCQADPVLSPIVEEVNNEK